MLACAQRIDDDGPTAMRNQDVALAIGRTGATPYRHFAELTFGPEAGRNGRPDDADIILSRRACSQRVSA